LFVALALPAAVRRRLGGWAEATFGPDPAVRAVPPDNLHVTLAFLGMQAADAVPAIADAALGAVRGLETPVLTPSGLTSVPPRRPRLFAADLADEEGRSAMVAAAAGQALADAGFYELEDRPFWPHVTVARVRRGDRPAGLSAKGLPADSFQAPEVVLYRSVQGGGGVRYEPLAGELLAT
jgi:2'-5' RNA ligase